MKLPKPQILFLDIETLPNVAWTWGKYEQNVLGFLKQSCIATFAAKLLGQKAYAYSLPDYGGYFPGSYNDKDIVTSIHSYLDSADIVVAHNGASFDSKVINGRFIVHGMDPPSPYKMVDTKLMVKKVARYNSHKLDDLGELLGEGRKIHTDFNLWRGCMAGDKKAWKRMVLYNKRDVMLLERLYLRLLPWMNHPNIGAYTGSFACPKCGSRQLQAQGYRVNTTRRYQRYQCQHCGGWSSAVGSDKDYKAQLTNVA